MSRPLEYILNPLFLLPWAALLFFLLRYVGQRYFHEPMRAEIAAGTVVVAFFVGAILPYYHIGHGQSSGEAQAPAVTVPVRLDVSTAPGPIRDYVWHHTVATEPVNWSIWKIVRNLSYTIQGGDRFEYDQFIDAKAEPGMVAGADFLFNKEADRFTVADIVDQAGNHPVAAVGHGKWVHRAFDLSKLVGQHLTVLDSQLNGAGYIGARYANVVITGPNGKIRYRLYTKGKLHDPQPYSDRNVKDTVVTTVVQTAGK